MKLEDILKQQDIEAALTALEYRGRPAGKGFNPIKVNAYVVRAHWRRRPVRNRKHRLRVIAGGKGE